MTKTQLMHAAEVFDTWRVVPRVLLFAYSWFVARTTDYILGWYFSQPATGRGTQETAVILGVFTALTGLAGYVFRVYVENGRDWVQNPPTDEEVKPMSTPLSKVEVEGSKIWAWVKSEWAHVPTWLGLAYVILKHL